LLAVIVIIDPDRLRPGSGKPTAANTHTPASSTATASAPACLPANVKVVAVTDALSYAAGVDPSCR
jgi:hypothetical protein